MPRNPSPSLDARHSVADGVRRAAADMCLAARQLDAWLADPYYQPKFLTDKTRADLADTRDRLTALLADAPKGT